MSTLYTIKKIEFHIEKDMYVFHFDKILLKCKEKNLTISVHNSLGQKHTKQNLFCILPFYTTLEQSIPYTCSFT